MAPTPSDDALPPRRSRRATLALITSFVIATLLAILGHLDRMPAPPGGTDWPPPDPAGEIESARWPSAVAVGVRHGLSVGIDVDDDAALLPAMSGSARFALNPVPKSPAARP